MLSAIAICCQLCALAAHAEGAPQGPRILCCPGPAQGLVGMQWHVKGHAARLSAGGVLAAAVA